MRLSAEAALALRAATRARVLKERLVSRQTGDRVASAPCSRNRIGPTLRHQDAHVPSALRSS